MTDHSSGDAPILFGRMSLPARTQVHQGYLARPDVRGSYPTILFVPPARGITAPMTYVCRAIARYGFAVVAVDLHRGDPPGRDVDHAEARVRFEEIPAGRMLGDLDDAARFLRGPGTEWSDPDRIGLLGIGAGGWAAVAAAPRLAPLSLALCYAPLGAGTGTHGRPTVDLIAEVRAPILALYGRDDSLVDIDLVPTARERARHAEWVLYQDVGHGFLDDDHDGYDAAAPDAVQRLVEFFARTLTVRPAPATAG